MGYRDLVTVCFVAKYLVIALWIFLFLQLCWFTYRKNYPRLKLTILYCLNTSVFFIVVAYVIDMGIIVLAPIKETFGESAQALRDIAFQHFRQHLWSSLIVIVLLGGINFLYMKYVMKEIKIRTMLRLGIAHVLILISGSVLACSMYYIGLMPDVSSRFDPERANNNNVQFDSVIPPGIK